ncbi:MAG: hypothetical protein U0556_10770 [Dehalococcoidia bacterium]
MNGPLVSPGNLLQVLGALDASRPPLGEQGEPFSYAVWEAGAPAAHDPDPLPRTLLRAYHPFGEAASQHLNATV